MLEDPPVNFAISTRGNKPGIDHLGIQTDDAEELAVLKARAEAADMTLLDEGTTTCCYARSARSTGSPIRRAGLGAPTRWATFRSLTKRARSDCRSVLYPVRGKPVALRKPASCC